MPHRDVIAIRKIIDEMSLGIEMLGDMSFDSFLEDEKLKRALGMTCINIGELVKNVTDETRQANNGFPWKEVAGMRDITAHRYQTLRMDDVYNTVKVEYPNLRDQLLVIINDTGNA